MTNGLKVLLGLAALVVLMLCLSYVGNLRGWNSDISYCNEVSVPGSKAGAERDRDVIDFATAAAEARRASGDTGVAAKYDRIAARASKRRDETLLRAAVPCKSRFPKPSLLGG